MWRWLAVLVVVGCSKPKPPAAPRITCTDCSATSTLPDAFATHTKLHVQTSWEGECETDIVMSGGSDQKRNVCKQVPSEATMTCDGCVITRLFGQRYEMTLTKAGNATLRGSFRPADTRQPGTAMLGPIRVVKPTRVAATCRRVTAQEVSVTIELFADTAKLGSNRPQVSGNNASCVDDAVSEGERLSHRYRCATPTDAPSIEITVKTPDFESTTSIACAK
jgi:hypothetical protein